ncbi:MAG: LD-carboxypeptidase [Clostridia bacterium]|nr:LD-carboxypeptidase [Clostridia bacterium]
MKYPESLEKGNFIGVTTPSCGIGEKDVLRFENGVKNFENLGYRVIETENVRREKPRGVSAKKRADEFMELWENPDVKSIICATGGDFLCEVLDELDFDILRNSTPKWIQGYSDVTCLGYVFTTCLDIATLYAPNFKTYGMNEWHDSLKNPIRIMKNEEFTQYSYDKCESLDKWDGEDDPYCGYNLSSDVEWKNLYGEDKIKFSGRAIGGCFDVIQNLIGTKYDNVRGFIDKYKDDGIVWFFDIFDKSTSQLFTNLWQMRNCGYFDDCKGIIFGRPLFVREEYGMNFEDSIKEALKGIDIPVVVNADIGHLAPQIAVVNGGIIEVESSNGRGWIRNEMK